MLLYERNRIIQRFNQYLMPSDPSPATCSTYRLGISLKIHQPHKIIGKVIIHIAYFKIILQYQYLIVKFWRRERDSNPRWAFNPYSLSRGAPSATRPPLRRRAGWAGPDNVCIRVLNPFNLSFFHHASLVFLVRSVMYLSTLPHSLVNRLA